MENCTFNVKCSLELHADDDLGAAKVVGATVSLNLSENLDRDAYFTKDGVPNINGTKAITDALIHGLVGSIHYAHEKGQWDSAEHLRYIIGALERGFIEIVTFKEVTHNG